jgi:hypothetical protein
MILLCNFKTRVCRTCVYTNTTKKNEFVIKICYDAHALSAPSVRL